MAIKWLLLLMLLHTTLSLLSLFLIHTGTDVYAVVTSVVIRQ